MAAPKNISHITVSDINNGIKYHVTLDQRNNLASSYNAFTTVLANSGGWESAESTVKSNSAIWAAGGDLSTLGAASGGWNSTESTVLANSAQWTIDVSGLAPSTFKSYTGTVETDLSNLSGQIDQNTADIVIVATASGNWDSVYNTILSTSAEWITNTVFKAYSAQINSNILTISAEVTGNTSNISTNTSQINTNIDNITTNFNSIQNIESIVEPNSAGWNSAKSTLESNSANWDNVRSTVVSNSAGWETTDPKVSNQTGTSYTLTLSDAERMVFMNNVSGNTVFIPINASVAFNINTSISILQEGTGTTSISGSNDVMLNGTSGGVAAINSQYNAVTVIKRDTDSWIIFGGHGGVS